MTDRAKDQPKDLTSGLFLIPAILLRFIIFKVWLKREISVFKKRAAHTECDLKGLGISQQAVSQKPSIGTLLAQNSHV